MVLTLFEILDWARYWRPVCALIGENWTGKCGGIALESQLFDIFGTTVEREREKSNSWRNFRAKEKDKNKESGGESKSAMKATTRAYTTSRNSQNLAAPFPRTKTVKIPYKSIFQMGNYAHFGIYTPLLYLTFTPQSSFFTSFSHPTLSRSWERRWSIAKPCWLMASLSTICNMGLA